MRHAIQTLAIILLATLVSCGGGPPTLADDEGADQAIAAYVREGTAAIPALKTCLADGNPKVRARAVTALAHITGQWGWNDGLIWKRSVAEAVNPTTPLLVLHLFGEFDHEFC